MEKNVSELYEDYREGRTSRRDFLKKLAMVAGSTAAALALIPVLENNELKATGKPKKEPALETEFIKYPGETGEMRAYLARPQKGKKFPAVIVIH